MEPVDDAGSGPRIPTALIRFQLRTEILVVGPRMPPGAGRVPPPRDGSHPRDHLVGQARLHGWTSLPGLEAAHAAGAAGTPLAGDCEGGWDDGGIHGGGAPGAREGGDGIWSDRGL